MEAPIWFFSDSFWGFGASTKNFPLHLNWRTVLSDWLIKSEVVKIQLLILVFALSQLFVNVTSISLVKYYFHEKILLAPPFWISIKINKDVMLYYTDSILSQFEKFHKNSWKCDLFEVIWLKKKKTKKTSTICNLFFIYEKLQIHRYYIIKNAGIKFGLILNLKIAVKNSHVLRT